MAEATGHDTSAPAPAPDSAPILDRASDVSELIDAVKALIVPFIADADRAFPERAQGGPSVASGQFPVRTALVEPLAPAQVVSRLQLALPEGEGGGHAALLDCMRRVLALSVNTWDQGFLDKLYAATTPVGVVSDLLLSVLNTNVHVFQVSPALTVVEKTTARALAGLFGFSGPRAGGITTSGGSTSNFTSLIVARNTLFPDTKIHGNGTGRRFAVFTSAHGHYSVEKAAQAAGLGSGAVWPVAVDAAGAMVPEDLKVQIAAAEAAGMTPFYVNATAGTTVMGSYDPFEAIADICRSYGSSDSSTPRRLWLHIDGSWGGAAIFSARHRHKLRGSHLADSLTVNPHKMLNVPLSCSYLLGPDMRVFHQANTLPAGYLFHGGGGEEEGEEKSADADAATASDSPEDEVWDLADLTLQCGRRADSLKLALAWVYEGAAGFERRVDHAFDMAVLLARLLSERPGAFSLVSSHPPPCLQVCFYFASVDADPAVNTARTRAAVKLLVRRGFMIDFAPGAHGSFFRVVINCQTRPGTVEGIVRALEAVRPEVV